MSTKSFNNETDELRPEHFRWAEKAGASDEFIRVASSFPKSTAGRDLLMHVRWGRLHPNVDPEEFTFLGGGFTDALWAGNMRVAFAAADKNNRRILRQLFGLGDS